MKWVIREWFDLSNNRCWSIDVYRIRDGKWIGTTGGTPEDAVRAALRWRLRATREGV